MINRRKYKVNYQSHQLTKKERKRNIKVIIKSTTTTTVHYGDECPIFKTSDYSNLFRQLN